jgi:hypothetical protein
VAFAVMLWGGGMSRTGVATVGGIAGAALITSIASQGLQYIGGHLTSITTCCSGSASTPS